MLQEEKEKQTRFKKETIHLQTRVDKVRRFFATLFLVALCMQMEAIEGGGVSLVKVAVMGLSPLLFILMVPMVSSALLLGGIYWGACLILAYYHAEVRFSTIGYLGMFVGTFVVYYNLLRRGAFSLEYFTKLLRAFIIAYGVVLIMQQAAVLVGLRGLWFINLNNQHFLSITKLPSLSLEPSHSARVLAVMMLGYWRCLELRDGKKPTVNQLFSKEHKRVTLLFGWAMLTMGSGTAFVALAILSLYFVQARSMVYVLPLFVGLFMLGQMLELENMERAQKVAMAVTTGEQAEVQAADGSAADRVLPTMNTFLHDEWGEASFWLGKGTTTDASEEFRKRRKVSKILVVEQYGFITFLISGLLVYTCMIRRIVSLETLMFVLLFGMSVINFAYVWGAYMIFAGVRYFQERPYLYRETGYMK